MSVRSVDSISRAGLLSPASCSPDEVLKRKAESITYNLLEIIDREHRTPFFVEIRDAIAIGMGISNSLSPKETHALVESLELQISDPSHPGDTICLIQATLNIIFHHYSNIFNASPS